MTTRGASRWDANVHYYDYTAETLRREPHRDAFVVAEAFIYDPNKIEVKAAITVLASAIPRAPTSAQRRGRLTCERRLSRRSAAPAE
jgi:hypothetical protein